MFCGTDNTPWIIPHNIWGIFDGILSVPQNIVMDLNNVLQHGYQQGYMHICKIPNLASIKMGLGISGVYENSSFVKVKR